MILAPATFDLGVVLQPDELCSEAPPGSIAAFEDAILESIVRLQLALGPLDDLTCDLLSSLTDVDARDLGIASVVGVQNLTSLTELYLSDNSISDSSALSGLTGLTTLGLEENTITDISALSGLTSLHLLGLDRNTNLSNIQPLLANQGLGATDEVRLQSTSVSCTDVAALIAKGVNVLGMAPC